MLRFPSFWCFLRVPICFCASTLNVSLFQPCGWRGRPPSYVPRGAVPWGVNEGAVPRCDLQCVWVSVHLFPPHFPYIALLVCLLSWSLSFLPLWVPVWLREPTGFDWSWGPSQCVGSLRMCMPEVLDEITHCDRALDTTQY
jgi:hypothetical protein